MAKENGVPLALHDFAKGNGLAREVHFVGPGGPSLTRQEFADECDINTIMARYDAHLADPMRSVREPRYYDFTEMPDTLMGTMAILNEAQEAFMRLPAQIRKEFDNDPAAFLDFASNPDKENQEMLREWGLCEPEKAPPEPLAVRVVSETPETPKGDPVPPNGGPAHVST